MVGRYKTPIPWPEEFIEKIKKWSPGDLGVIRTLKNGGYVVLLILDNSRMFTLTPEEIVEAFEKGEGNKIYEEAKRCLAAGKLLEEAEKIAEPFLKGSSKK